MKKGQIKKLKKELDDIEVRINTLKPSDDDFVTDTVNDYSTGFPRVITISGYGDEKYKAEKDRLYNKYVRKKIEILKEIEHIEELISNEDPETQTILRMVYIDGLTQEEIAEKMSYSRDTIKRRIKNFKNK